MWSHACPVPSQPRFGTRNNPGVHQSLLFCSLVLVSCLLFFGIGFLPGVAQAKGLPVLLGALWDLSGERQREGTAALIAARRAVEGINAQGGVAWRQLELVVVDIRGESGKLFLGVRTLTEREGVVALVGPTAAGVEGPLQTYADSHHIPVVLTVGEEVLLPSRERRPVQWAFRVSPARSAVIRALYQAISQSGLKRVGLLVADDTASGEAALWLKAYATEFRLRVVDILRFGAEDTDMRAQLEDVRDAGAQVVVVWGPRDRGEALARSARGLDLPLAVPPGFVSGRLLRDLSSGQELWAVLPPLLVWEALPRSHPCAFAVGTYVRNMETPLDATPEYLLAGGSAWDAVHLLATAVRQAGTPNPESLRQALEELAAPYVGVLGVFQPTKRDHCGLDPSSLVVARWINGRWEPVAP